MEPEGDRRKAVMSMIAAATDLEASGRELEAFHSYLSSVRSVCALLDSGLPSATDRSQMIALAKRCLERIQHISDGIGRGKPQIKPESPESAAAAAVEGRLQRLRAPPAPEPAWSTYRAASLCEPTAPSLDDSPTSIEDNRLVPDLEGAADPDLAPETGPEDAADPGLEPAGDEDEDPDHLPSIEDNTLVVVPPEPAADAARGAEKPPSAERRLPDKEDSSTGRRDNEPFYFATDIVHRRVPVPKPIDELDPSQELSPLDVARRENERLVASYALRMQRSPVHVQHNLSLELQRRLTENRQIASGKHQAWLQRRHESRQHFVQLAKRVFPVPTGGQATPDDLQKQATFADILQFEQAHPWTRQLRNSLDAAPESARAVENALLHMLLEKSHPLSKLRQRLQYSLFCKVNPLVEQHAHLLDAVRVPAWSPAERRAGWADRADASRDGEAARPATDRPGPAGTSQRRRDRPTHAEKPPDQTESRSRPDPSQAEGPAGAGEDRHQPDSEAGEVGERPSPPPAAEAAVPSLWPQLPLDDVDGAVKEGSSAEELGSGDDADSREQRQQAEAFRRHLRNVISDTQDSEQLLESVAEAVHPSLCGAQSRPVVQRVLFTPLWPHLLVLFRLANRQQEQRLAAALTRLAAAGSQPPPSHEHRVLLRRLLLATSPADKCRLLVELVRALCATADGPAGADVLLPRLTALVVHSGAPQLLSELQFVSEFMSDGSFQGEQGYCLTSLQTVLLYLVQQQ